VAYYERSKIEDSIKWFHKAEALNSSESVLLNYIAMGYDEKEEYDNA
jgi:hypothetical protein